MSKKVCTKCGQEKSLNEFYIRSECLKEYGKNDPRSYRHQCKTCCSNNAKKQRAKRISYTEGLYFVYFVFNHNEELIYIGKTNDIYNRIKQHQIENRFCEDDVYYIEFELLKNPCDAGVREIYYINKYKPILNQRDVFDGEIIDTIINDLNRLRVYRHDKEQFKNDINKAIKQGVNYSKPITKYSKPVLKIDPKTMKIIQKYDTCKQAEEDNNISEGGVSRAAKKGGKSGGFYWQYVNQEDKDTDRFKNIV